MAFKMSPIGRNKDPYASMAKRGYIAPTKQGMEILDPEKGQSTVDDAAENNITWSEPSDWKPADDGTNREMRTTTGVGNAEGYYEGKEKMGNEKWKEFLKTPEGKKYTASKNKSKTEYRDTTIPTPKEKSSEIPHDNVSERMNESKVDMGVKSQESSEPVTKTRYVMKYNDATGKNERMAEEYQVYEKPNSSKTSFDTQNRETVSDDYVKNNPDDKSVKTHSLTGDFDRIAKEDQKTIESNVINENKNKGELSDEYTLDQNSPAPQSAARQLMNKYMPAKSMVKQQTKTTYISDNESDKPGKEGWEENKQRYENAKLLTNELKSGGKGDKADLDLNLSYQSMMPEVEITSPPQLRGHSIATQCAKSEGGSGCVKKMGSGWKVISNKTGKPWDANYDSEASANAALKAYHAG